MKALKYKQDKILLRFNLQKKIERKTFYYKPELSFFQILRQALYCGPSHYFQITVKASGPCGFFI